MRIVRSCFVFMAVLLVASIAIMYGIGVADSHLSAKSTAAHLVIDRLNETLSTVKDAETGQRGYVLTGKSKYLDPYHAAISNIGADRDALDKLASSDALDPADVNEVKQLINEKLQELEMTVRLRRDKDFDAAVVEIDSDRGQQLMQKLRDTIAGMTDKATQRLNDAERTVVSAHRWRDAVYIAVGVINLLFLFWAYRKISLGIAQRDAATLELKLQKDLVSVTLASIGDGVIVTDLRGDVTYLNPEAEKLTGWTLADAQGLSCSKVFNIINEDSRQRVDSPVEKVLRSGAIVGLANHTLLIRQDGTELPIDDSGAPIRNPEGTVRGVVLVFRDFTENKENEKKLRDAKEAAEAANIAKDNFLATLSHELRTPLAPVLATLSLWESGSEMPATLAGEVQMMRRNVELEARLIDDLLDLTRILKGKLPLNLETTDVHKLIESVAGMYRSEINGKQLKLSLQLDANRHFVQGDPARLQQVFWNIFKNAIKFTPGGGAIDVASRNDANGHVLLSFRDTGIGMEAETMSRLFEPFEQGSAETMRHYGGLGLGMSISKSLLKAQGGEIMAESKGRGQGATFTVTLSTVAGPDPNGRPATKAGSPMHKSLNILLVEDHVDTARAMSRLLRSQGHQVRAAGTVAEALQSARQPFDLLLSDIGLPDGTGVELIRQIREQYGDGVTAIALTGFGMEDDLAKCRKAGFDDHLTKPVNLQSLERMLQQIMTRPRNSSDE